jgi:hypothetical protein
MKPQAIFALDKMTAKFKSSSFRKTCLLKVLVQQNTRILFHVETILKHRLT